MSNSLKRKALVDISCKPSKLIRSELKQGDIPTLTNNDLSLIRHNIHRARLSVHPSLPSCIEELHVALGSMKIKTNIGEQFLFVNDIVNSIVGFSTQQNIKVLCDVKKIYVDGTFKSCPKNFTQLFTIHGLKNSVYLPLVFFLLPNKLNSTYKCAFQHVIRHSISVVGISCSPTDIFIDFESAIHSAVADVFPNAQIRGCRFHLGQSWWRKIQSLGLTKLYNDNTDDSHYLKYFFGLPFLEPENVIDCFTDDFLAIQPAENDRIVIFTDYIFENYISPDAMFPPNIWAQFTASCNRTTNSCESFHSKLNMSFYTSHPNIYNFVDVLLEVQSETYIKFRSKSESTKKMCEKEAFIREQMTKFELKEIDNFELVKSLSFKFLPKQ
ncbi:uncharacterized protein LOC107884772 [Acyrthosiphon pisum]|uniref:MULE transposase domain-containing protein n=1 Tax=Acyrthosiphon pisum TaxID=7029 RepID=A0A8R2D617_ACYPI|nr:uncharacterized protein LOC107884772 [Acyrthosiphon pisum]|eukprot:XP_016663060.1 PREDICTED: uncharacterized protein LOC107884772 [Acyrthosiphon pisum]